MTLRPGLRRFALTVHVGCSVASLGAVAAFLILAVTGLSGGDERLVRAAYLGMNLIIHFAVVPLILAALLTGIIQGIGTPWGLVRHYWVLAKLVLTVLIIGVLLLQLTGIGQLAVAAASEGQFAPELNLRRSAVLHATGGLVALLLPLALSVYKPRGMTRYGWRKHHRA